MHFPDRSLLTLVMAKVSMVTVTMTMVAMDTISFNVSNGYVLILVGLGVDVSLEIRLVHGFIFGVFNYSFLEFL